MQDQDRKPGDHSPRPHAVRPGATLCMALTALALLSGCKEQKPGTVAADATTTGRIRTLAEQAIRTTGAKGAGMQFRGVQVYDQALPGHWAVCGQVAPFADDPNIFVPFVSVLTPPGGRSKSYQVEQHVGTSTAEADGVYLALVGFCYEKGGPAPGPIGSVAPMPPLPDTVADPSRRPAASAPPAPPAVPASRPVPAAAPPATADAPPVAAASVPASGSVTMRQNANIHAAPHGPSVRVVPQGTVMRIFATASGGWYQVGDTAPWGWVHDSMVERH